MGRGKLRWALPAGAVIAAGGVLAGTMLASAAAPTLPHRTPAQLLAAISHARANRPMTAVISESANLGIPALPDIGGPPGVSSAFSAASFLAGTHTIDLWYGGPGQLRVALPVSFGESDLRVNGSQVWLWDSRGQTATHLVIPSRPHGEFMRPAGAGPLGAITPLQAAKLLLAKIGPTTRVTVAGTATIAGRSAYLLAIAPRSTQSLIGRVTIALDARTHLPLQVQVFARGTASPAFQVGFTSLSFARPASSNFTFTPPPGAKVKTIKLGHAGFGAVTGQADPGLAQVHGKLAGQVRGFGTGWLAVGAFPAGKLLGPAAGAHGQVPALAGLLLKAMTPVRGSWGSGRLLSTKLLSVLITSKGEVLIGAVTPAVLYADAAQLK